MATKKQKNSNVPNLRFPGFDGEWKVVKLKDCAVSLDYGMNAAATLFDGENKYIRITDIDERSSKYISNPPVSPDGDLTDHYLVQENDILFARTGASTGKSYIYDVKDGKIYFAGFLIRARIRQTYNARFVFAQTQTENYNRWVKLMSMRSGQPGINSQEYGSYNIAIPSRKEQNIISSFLTLIDERIQTQSKIIEELKTHQYRLREQIFTQKNRFKDHDGKKFPDWNLDKLYNVLIKNSSKNKDLKYSNVQSVSNKFGFINQDDFFEDRRVASIDTSNYHVIEKGCFAYNPSRINVGSLAYKYDDIISIVSPLYICFKADNSSITDRFLLEWFSTKQFIQQMNSSFEGSVRNTLNYENLGKMNILIPCMKEQKIISDFFYNINEKIKIEKKMLLQYEVQKKYLLQTLFI